MMSKRTSLHRLKGANGVFCFIQSISKTCILSGMQTNLNCIKTVILCCKFLRVGHPCDRQSQVDFNNPDLERFSEFRNAKGVEATLEPGDVLYIPRTWFHHIISLDHTVSVNFWFLAKKKSEITYPLSAEQKVSMTRNVESMLYTALKSPEEVTEFLNTIVRGRYDSDVNHVINKATSP
eukprot:m.86178 g.86178  ORF g.86178 m.86178 type:complete len:179 (-) comp13047_c0_seq2:29-565(-)